MKPRKLYALPVTAVTIRDMAGEELFELLIYGTHWTDLCSVPEGGRLVRAALRRAGLDPDMFHSSIFDVEKVR